MKKFFAILAAILLLPVMACSSGGDSGGSDETSDQLEENTPENKVSIFAIDGLDFDRTYKGLLSNADFNYPARVEYLCSGILEAKVLNIKGDDCYSFRGTNPDESWSGDATQTFDYLDELISDLAQKAQQAKQEGKKFIVVTHSWGTQLGTLGLSLSGVEPDLFITLSDPEGSTYVNDTSYSNEFFKVIPPLSVSSAETLILDLTQIYGVGALSPINVKTKKWINYWDVGDIISGPLKSIHISNSIEDRTVINCAERNYETTKKVHAITSLKESFWTEGNGVSKEIGKAFKDRVISDILQVL
jgi:hypothetical protein